MSRTRTRGVWCVNHPLSPWQPVGLEIFGLPLASTKADGICQNSPKYTDLLHLYDTFQQFSAATPPYPNIGDPHNSWFRLHKCHTTAYFDQSTEQV